MIKKALKNRAILWLQFSLFCSLFYGLKTTAQVIDLDGFVHFSKEVRQAHDVVYQQKILTPDELHNLQDKLDISDLDPDSSTDYWRPSKTYEAVAQINDLNLSENTTFVYTGHLDSRVGRAQVSVQAKDLNGVVKNYIINASVKNHSILMKKAFLKKLGYQVENLQYYKKLNLKFLNHSEMQEFLENFESDTLKKSELWIVDPTIVEHIKNKNYVIEDLNLILQDVLVLPIPKIQDLSIAVHSEISVGSRFINALLLVEHLFDLPEDMNINAYEWQKAQLAQNGVYLSSDSIGDLKPSREDVRWLLKKIAKLNKKDFNDVIEFSQMPKEEKLLFEQKLISNRNHLMKLFDVESPALKFDSNISYGERLKDGKLVVENTTESKAQNSEAHAERFAWGDPPSIINPKEAWSIFKSKFYSSVISSKIAEFNANILKPTNVTQKIFEHQLKNAEQQFVQLITTGHTDKIHFGMYVIPTTRANLILSRDLVIGSYMGTNNRIQVVDNFGFAFSKGLFIGFDGIQPPQLNVYAGTSLSYMRSFAHIHPTKNAVSALTTPYQNMIVPFYEYLARRSLDKVLETNSMQNSNSEDNLKEFQNIIKAFDEHLNVGDSLVITDSINLGANFNVSYPLAQSFSAQAQISDSEVLVLKRIHIFHRDRNQIQVFIDSGAQNILGFNISLNKYKVQVVSLGLSRGAGNSKTDYYNLDYFADQNTQDYKEIKNKIKIIRDLMFTHNLDSLQDQYKPTHLEHDFNQKAFDFSFLFFKFRSQKTFDQLKIKYPNQYQENLAFKNLGTRSGPNYESLVVDSLQNYIQDRLKNPNAVISDPSSGDPGDSIYGSSVKKEITAEAKLNPNISDHSDMFSEVFAQIKYSYKGWNMKREEMLQVFNDFKANFHFPFIWQLNLNDTQEVQFYNLGLEVRVYQTGIDNLARIGELESKKMFLDSSSLSEEKVWKLSRGSQQYRYDAEKFRTKLWREFVQAQKEYHKSLKNHDTEEALTACLKMLDYTENIFSGTDLINLVGGYKHIMITPFLEGLRKGDELGELKAPLNSFGMLSTEKSKGPFRYLQNILQMPEGEFFSYWMINHL